MRNVLTVAASALILVACAPAPVPRGPVAPSAPELSDTAASAEPSPEPSAPSSEAVDDGYEIPADDAENEAARIVVSANDEESAVTVGPQQLGPDFTIAAQCRGVEKLTLNLHEASTTTQDVESGEPATKVFKSVEVPCGEIVDFPNTVEDAPNAVQPLFVSDEGDYEAWATVTNGVG